jgi:hypothetical protein
MVRVRRTPHNFVLATKVIDRIMTQRRIKPQDPITEDPPCINNNLVKKVFSKKTKKIDNKNNQH